MNKKFKESKYYQDWIIKAKRDFSTAVLNHKHSGYTDVTCYFCQQAVEKIFKAYLLFKGEKYLPQTHILPSLLALCVKYSPDFSRFKKESEILDQYYIETKYPSLAPVDYDKEEAERAIGMSEKILEFVNKKIK